MEWCAAAFSNLAKVALVILLSPLGAALGCWCFERKKKRAMMKRKKTLRNIRIHAARFPARRLKASKLPSCDGDIKQKEEKKSASKKHLDTMESPLWVRVASVYLLCAIMTNHACAVALDDRGASQKGQPMRPGERHIIKRKAYLLENKRTCIHCQ